MKNSWIVNTFAVIGVVAVVLLAINGLPGHPLEVGAVVQKPTQGNLTPRGLVPITDMDASRVVPVPPTITPKMSTATPKVAAAVSTETPKPVSVAGSSGKLGEEWKIEYFSGATLQMKAWVFQPLDPVLWPMFPNVDNGKYLASQGVEYGEDLDTFCQQGQICDFVVAARHYRLYTGDYNFTGVGTCVAEDRRGCALMVVNVGDVTAIFRNQNFDTGFTVTGRYWDGNYLSQAIWATLSYASNNMLNLNSTLNPSPINNAGANCSVPEGCLSVENTFVVISGNEILFIGRSVVEK